MVLVIKKKVVAQAQVGHSEEQQAQHKPKVSSKSLTTEQVLIDEAVQIDAELKASEAYEKLKRLDELKKQLQSIAQTFPAGEEAILTGSIGEVVMSPAKKNVELSDKDGLIEKIGQEAFNQIAKPTMTDIKKYLSEIEIAKVTNTTTGSRTLKTIRKYE